ncbi:MAG: hypothetical protein ABNH26_08510 [Celeribacter sp.]|jgi:hypothetical protein
MTKPIHPITPAALPDEIMVWRSNPYLNHLGAWATTRYPAEAVRYVPADPHPEIPDDQIREAQAEINERFSVGTGRLTPVAEPKED